MFLESRAGKKRRLVIAYIYCYVYDIRLTRAILLYLCDFFYPVNRYFLFLSLLLLDLKFTGLQVVLYMQNVLIIIQRSLATNLEWHSLNVKWHVSRNNPWKFESKNSFVKPYIRHYWMIKNQKGHHDEFKKHQFSIMRSRTEKCYYLWCV